MLFHLQILFPFLSGNLEPLTNLHINGIIIKENEQTTKSISPNQGAFSYKYISPLPV